MTGTPPVLEISMENGMRIPPFCPKANPPAIFHCVSFREKFLFWKSHDFPSLFFDLVYDGVLVYACPVDSVDKPPLARDALEERLHCIQEAGFGAVVTRAPLFAEKAALFAGCSFIMGYDTIIRLLDPRLFSLYHSP